MVERQGAQRPVLGAEAVGAGGAGPGGQEAARGRGRRPWAGRSCPRCRPAARRRRGRSAARRQPGSGAPPQAGPARRGRVGYHLDAARRRASRAPSVSVHRGRRRGPRAHPSAVTARASSGWRCVGVERDRDPPGVEGAQQRLDGEESAVEQKNDPLAPWPRPERSATRPARVSGPGAARRSRPSRFRGRSETAPRPGGPPSGRSGHERFARRRAPSPLSPAPRRGAAHIRTGGRHLRTRSSITRAPAVNPAATTPTSTSVA